MWQRAWQAWTATLAAADIPARLADLLAADDDSTEAEAAYAAAVARLATGDALPPTDTLRLLLRDVLGLRIEGEGLRWHLLAAPPCGVRRLPVGQNVVSLYVAGDVGGGIAVEVDATHPLFLDVETASVSFSETLPAGHSRLLLTHLDRTDVRAE